MILKFFFEELAEVGVCLNERRMNRLLESLTEVFNTTHLWSNYGWTPDELARKMNPQGRMPDSVSFGPGIQQAIRDGAIDEAELIHMFEQMGLNVIR